MSMPFPSKACQWESSVLVYNKPTLGHTAVSQKNKGAEKESSVVLRLNFYISLHVSELYRIGVQPYYCELGNVQHYHS